MASTIRIRVGPWLIVAYVNDDELADQLRYEWQYTLAEGEDAVPGRRGPSATLRVYRADGHVRIYHPLAPRSVLGESLSSRAFAVTMNAIVRSLARRDKLTPLHAGGVLAPDGTPIIIPGSTKTGKSTLVYALSQLGLPVLSDEHLILDPATSSIIPYPKPVTIRRNAVTLLNLDRQLEPDHGVPSQSYPMPGAVAPDPVSNPLVVWLDKQANDAAWVATELAFAWLLGATAFDELKFRDFDSLAHFASRCDNFRLPREEPTLLAEVALDLIDATPLGNARTSHNGPAARVHLSEGRGQQLIASFATGRATYDPDLHTTHVQAEAG